MPKRDAIVVEGVVTEALPNAMFRVSLDGGRMVLAHLSGKVRLNFVRVLPGHREQEELTPYALSNGRISSRDRH
jgi:translation initiation factor IF-1